MTATLENVAHAVVREAQRKGYVVPRDIRTELKLAGLPEDQWKEVAALTKESLHYRQGRYYPLGAISPRLQKEQEQQRVIQKVVRQLIKQHRAAIKQQDRRGQERIDFIQPVAVHTEDGKSFQLLSRDLSSTGIRLLGTRRLLGQKVRIDLPPVGDSPTCSVWVRVLWTCAVGDDMFENGGTFLEIVQ
jgi:PilZ domain